LSDWCRFIDDTGTDTMLNRLTMAGMALLIAAMPVRAQDAPATTTMPLPLARAVAGKTIELVETRAVYPRRQADYDAAKAELLAALDKPGGDIDRRALSMRIARLLDTLDADGHSFVMPARGRAPVQGQLQPRAHPVAESQRPSAFQLVATGSGKVLRWTPPPILDGGAASAAYLRHVDDEAKAIPDTQDACALVIDLTEQTGGNAWPPLIAMRALFGDTNRASMVDRDGKRAPFVSRAGLEAMARRQVGQQVDPLEPFATTPVAVVIGNRTSSAGEMLLIALLGEPRVQTFGHPSGGLSTANMTHALPDGSTLVLTERRYAQADGPVYRGRIAPMHVAADDETIDATVKRAAEWAAANSPRCKPPTVAARD
jgi:hypothetical protein